MPPSRLFRSPGQFLLFATCIGAATTRAQVAPALPADPELALDRYVVSATRTPQDPASTPSSVTRISLDDLEAEQISTLRGALALEPGVALVSSGAAGAQTSVFIRGANPDEVLFVVDGVRMNDRSAAYNNFLGTADLAGTGRIEVLRGPQSTLYGSSAVGGVILIDSERGHGSPNGAVSVTAGSFDSYGASASLLGSTRAVSYSASVERFATANDRPYNAMRQWTYASRIEYAAAENVTIGATFRGENSHYEEPGAITFPSQGAVTFGNYLGSVFGEMRVADDLTSRLTLALHHRTYAFDYGFGISNLSNTRQIVDWQNTWAASRALEIVAGANVEHARYLIDGVASADELGAGYVSATARPVRTVTLTAGGRYDDFKTIGSAFTWRTGVAWEPQPGTKWRATYGTGFSAPGSDDRYGVVEFGQLPSPDLKPEKSRGWDAGVDQTLFEGRATLSATYFENKFRNLFEYSYVDYVTFQGRTVNRARASTRGVEFAATARWRDWMQTRVAYTYLDATNDSDDVRLIRRPRHLVDAEVRVQATPAWSVGAGVHGVMDRVDRGGPIEDYAVVRVFTSYAFRRAWIAKLRVENALDERYEETLGYPALGRAVFGTVEWKY